MPWLSDIRLNVTDIKDLFLGGSFHLKRASLLYELMSSQNQIFFFYIRYVALVTSHPFRSARTDPAPAATRVPCHYPFEEG